MDKIAFGACVRTARKRAKLTAEKLSELCDCSTVSIRQIERGNRLPSLPGGGRPPAFRAEGSNGENSPFRQLSARKRRNRE